MRASAPSTQAHLRAIARVDRTPTCNPRSQIDLGQIGRPRSSAPRRERPVSVVPDCAGRAVCESPPAAEADASAPASAAGPGAAAIRDRQGPAGRRDWGRWPRPPRTCDWAWARLPHSNSASARWHKISARRSIGTRGLRQAAGRVVVATQRRPAPAPARYSTCCGSSPRRVVVGHGLQGQQGRARARSAGDRFRPPESPRPGCRARSPASADSRPAPAAVVRPRRPRDRAASRPARIWDPAPGPRRPGCRLASAWPMARWTSPARTASAGSSLTSRRASSQLHERFVQGAAVPQRFGILTVRVGVESARLRPRGPIAISARFQSPRSMALMPWSVN